MASSSSICVLCWGSPNRVTAGVEPVLPAPASMRARYFRAAPWSTALKVMSLLGTVVLCAVSYAAFRAIPTPTGFTHHFGLGVALIPLVVLIASLFFVVRGYSVDARHLIVERLVTTTRIPLAGLTRAWIDPSACKGSIRVFGNGGLFSFSGWFYSKRLGRYRLFATDFRHAVVLGLPRGNVVISPAAPHAFIEHLQRVVPGLHIGAEARGA